jgi:hypothetical protein
VAEIADSPYFFPIMAANMTSETAFILRIGATHCL